MSNVQLHLLYIQGPWLVGVAAYRRISRHNINSAVSLMGFFAGIIERPNRSTLLFLSKEFTLSMHRCGLCRWKDFDSWDIFTFHVFPV